MGRKKKYINIFGSFAEPFNIRLFAVPRWIEIKCYTNTLALPLFLLEKWLIVNVGCRLNRLWLSWVVRQSKASHDVSSPISIDRQRAHVIPRSPACQPHPVLWSFHFTRWSLCLISTRWLCAGLWPVEPEFEFHHHSCKSMVASVKASGQTWWVLWGTVFFISKWKSTQRRHKHSALAVVRWSEKFCPPQTPFPRARDGQNLIGWRWSLPLPTDSVWWGSMHAISSCHGNRTTHTHTQTGRITILCATVSLAHNYNVGVLSPDVN